MRYYSYVENYDYEIISEETLERFSDKYGIDIKCYVPHKNLEEAKSHVISLFEAKKKDYDYIIDRVKKL